MNKYFVKVILAILVLVGIFYADTVSSQVKHSENLEKSKVRGTNQTRKIWIEEEKGDLTKSASIPKESLTNFREFIAYIFSNSPNLFYNEKAQRQFLSAHLRKAIAHHLEVFNKVSAREQVPTFPDNSTFVGSWDNPTSYLIVGTRRYKERVIIDVVYKWGQGTNYEGDTRLVSYSFIYEENLWKLEDAYTFQGKFISAYSLSKDLWNDNYEF